MGCIFSGKHEVKEENGYFLLTPNVAVHADLLIQMGFSTRHEKSYDLSFGERLLQADLCISDLDNQMTWYNVGERIAHERIGVKGLRDFAAYIAWAVEGVAGLHRALRTKTSPEQIELFKEIQWQEFYERFLRDPYNSLDGYSEGLKKEVVEAIQAMLTDEEIAQSLFPGVETFHAKIPAKNLILSRNLEPVLRAYGDYLGIREVIPDAYDRSTALDDFLSKNPQHKRLIIRVDGDNGEKELVRYAMNLVQEGRLDNVISILRTTTPDHLTSNEHPEFTVRVGTNDFGLIHLIDKAER